MPSIKEETQMNKPWHKKRKTCLFHIPADIFCSICMLQAKEQKKKKVHVTYHMELSMSLSSCNIHIEQNMSLPENSEALVFCFS